MDYLRLVKLEGEKRQRTGAVQNLAECVATLNCAKRFGVRQSSSPLALWSRDGTGKRFESRASSGLLGGGEDSIRRRALPPRHCGKGDVGRLF